MLRLIAALLIGVTLSVAPAYAATKVTVNGVPISDIEISQRTKLLSLEGGGGSSKAAMDQLINEQLQLQEAKKFNITITEQQVDDAFQQVSRNVKVSTDKLREILLSRGVSVDTMRARLRAALAWQQLSGIVVQSRVKVSDLDLDKEASAALNTDTSYDYILKEILFISTTGNAAARTGQANAYRKAFTGCDSAVQLSLNYTDAAVREMGRRHATQLPDALAKELAGLNVGGITKPRVTEQGVSMLAVCAKNAARDTTFIKNKLRSQQGSEAMKAESEKYLQELKAKAKIVYS
ncbi:MAG: SurA N-terminal domain-containing protein [Devosia sp.]|uniref:peptidylprolyl isomerase n=1 Tax=Devosia sp. TaxID=1871048 RepID=UPI001ACAB487|nr:SurA N-terminal domain-containing protein [Devosia sp.]MBN9316243.1 SurA N-terminal domain-containing protein [Devosia sp.]